MQTARLESRRQQNEAITHFEAKYERMEPRLDHSATKIYSPKRKIGEGAISWELD